MKRHMLVTALALTAAPMASAEIFITPIAPELPPALACEPVGWGNDPSQPCGANWLQGMVGQPLSYAYATDAAMNARILRPDAVVTMDYIPHRLNFHVDKADMISRIACG